MKQNIILAGATGLIGKKLITQLQHTYNIIVFTRNIEKSKDLLPPTIDFVDWEKNEDILTAVNKSVAIINLSGAPIIGKKWTDEYKKTLLDSRIMTTRKIVNAIEKAITKPQTLINGSAVGIYGMINDDHEYTEIDPPASDFLASLCKAWEYEALRARDFGTRVVCIRSGIILDAKEGALQRMLVPFRLFIGGPIGSGKQFFPWIHIDDEIGIILHALNSANVSGPLNAVAPEIITNKQLSRCIGRKLHKPNFISVPPFALKLLFGEASQVLTSGIKVSSQKVLKTNYEYLFPTINKALDNLL